MNYYLIKYDNKIYVFEAASSMLLVSKIAQLKLQGKASAIEYFGKIKHCFIANQIEYNCKTTSIEESSRLKYLYFSIIYNDNKLGYVYPSIKTISEDYVFLDNQKTYIFEERMFFNIAEGPKTNIQIYVEDKYTNYNIEIVQPLKITIQEFLDYYKNPLTVDTLYNSVCMPKIKCALVNQIKSDKKAYMAYFDKIIKCAEERNFNENR